MKDFLLYLVKQLTDHPESVLVDEKEIDQQVVFTLTLDKEDMGKVIGKEGKIIYAIRNLMKVRGIKEGLQVRVEIAESA